MTLKQFREATKDMPEDMDLFVAERKTEFAYGLVNSVYQEKINMVDDADDLSAPVKVIVIDEE